MNVQEQAFYDDIQQDLAWFSRNVIDRDMRKENKMLAKITQFHPSNFHITVENVETGKKYELTCPVSIFQQLQRRGVNTFWEFETHDDVVKNAVRRDPVDG